MRTTRRPSAAPLLSLATALLLAGCAGRHPVAVAVEAPPPPVVTAPMPEGASAGMLVPQPLPDGSFPTPNRQLSEAGAVWHLRAGLNVAALSCPGEAGATIRVGYNDWLTRQKAPLAQWAARYAAEYGSTTAAGRAAYDDAMTRLYNFFSQTPVRTAFCAAAASMVGDIATGDAAALPATAVARLPMLDRPFVDFYRAYDAWRNATPVRTVIAAAAVTSPGPAEAAPPSPAATRPTLVLDLSSLPVDTAVFTKP